jgi:chemotaxis protein CheD
MSKTDPSKPAPPPGRLDEFYSSDLESKRVRTAGFEASNDPHVVLVSGWLGGGLGLTAYDPAARVGGLIHAPLSDSSADERSSRVRPALFVDTGLPALFQAMARLGAEESRLQICLMGGARLLNRSAPFAPGHEMFSAAIRALAQHDLRPLIQRLTASADCRCGLEVATGEVRLRFSGQTRVTVLWKNSTAT